MTGTKFDKTIRPLVLTMPKDGDKDKEKKLMFFRVDDEKLLEKYKTIWTKLKI